MLRDAVQGAGDAVQTVAEATRHTIESRDVFGKVVALVIIGFSLGWATAVPVFSGASYDTTVGASSSVCGIAVALFGVAVWNFVNVLVRGKPLRIEVPKVLNEWIMLAVALLIGTTVSLSVFR